MRGWLVDVFRHEARLFVWIKTAKRNYFLRTKLEQSFYIGSGEKWLCIREALSRRFPKLVSFRRVKKKDFETGHSIEVLEVKLKNALKMRSVVSFLNREFKYALELFNADISPEQYFFFSRNIASLSLVEFSHRGGWLARIGALPFSVDEFPELKTMELDVEAEYSPRISFTARVVFIRADSHVFYGDERTVLLGFKEFYEQQDPDIVLFARGDEYGVRYLKHRMQLNGITFNFGRFGDSFTKARGRSYFSYGRIVRKNPQQVFKGRIHIDSSSFYAKEAGVAGIMEASRTARMPFQLTARRSPGTCISNLQLFNAFQLGYLIPFKKNAVEAFKSGNELFCSDKGGFVFEPLVGLHENVVELDFSSLYPSIMVNHNISPETVNCSCCSNARVPVLGYTVCERREGLIRKTLKPVLAKRLYLKKIKGMLAGKDRVNAERRCNALKWLLVTSFGYTGYKNARFGRIEAHESITAFAREKMLMAKEACEGLGWRVLHGLNDSLWIKKHSFSGCELETLVQEIVHKTGVEIVVEGVFKWIVFCPSVNDPRIGAVNRYFGCYKNGELKFRGIDLRKSDAPRIVKRMQAEQLAVLRKAGSAGAFRECIPKVIAKLREYIAMAETGRIPLEDFVVEKCVSRRAKDYRVNCSQKTVLEQLAREGMEVFEGETIEFVHSSANAKIPHARVKARQLLSMKERVDSQKYAELMVKATGQLLGFLGFGEQYLRGLCFEGRQCSLWEFEFERIPVRAKN